MCIRDRVIQCTIPAIGVRPPLRTLAAVLAIAPDVYKRQILFFLTPKEEVAHVEEDDTLRQVVEKLEYHLSLIHIYAC